MLETLKTDQERRPVCYIWPNLRVYYIFLKVRGTNTNTCATTVAWCMTYLFLNLRRTIRQPKPVPSLLVAGVMTNLVISGRKTLEVEFGV